MKPDHHHHRHRHRQRQRQRHREHDHRENTQSHFRFISTKNSSVHYLIYLLLGLIVVFTLRIGTSSGAVIAVIYETADQQQFSRILQKSVNEANLEGGEFTSTSTSTAIGSGGGSGGGGGGGSGGASRRVWMSVVSTMIDAGQSTARTIRDLCATLDNNSVSAIVSLANRETHGATLAAVTVAAYAGLPVLGYSPGYSPHQYKDLSPLFQSLNPSLKVMADAVTSFLTYNGWLSSTYLSDDSQTSTVFGRSLALRLKRRHRHAVINLMMVPSTSSSSSSSSLSSSSKSRSTADLLFDALADVHQRRSRVLIVHCTNDKFIIDLFEQAKRLHMTSGQFIWILIGDIVTNSELNLDGIPTGVLHFRFRSSLSRSNSKHVLRTSLRLLARALTHVDAASTSTSTSGSTSSGAASCWFPPGPSLQANSQLLFRELNRLTTAAIFGERPKVTTTIPDLYWVGSGLGSVSGDELGRREGSIDSTSSSWTWSLRATVDILNFVHDSDRVNRIWRTVGNVSAGRVKLDAVIWPGNTLSSPSPSWDRSSNGGRWRVVGALAPPFVMTSDPLGNHSCLVGIPCLRVTTNVKEELVAACAHYSSGGRLGRMIGLSINATRESGSGGFQWTNGGRKPNYNVTCCHGYSVDLLVNVAKELRIDYVFYLVADNRFGSYRPHNRKWDGIVGDLMSGAAHLAFAPLSVTAARIQHVDFSTPYYFSGVSFLTSTKFREVPLLAFLAPFSPGLWIAIFACLHVIAVTAAIYEWLSPFGLNPWGRQRTKNFSLASALWVTWSLLFSHLVAFKAPKSWPNKVLINLWGCFSVIFLASYTANHAALFAGLFFQTTVNDFNDQSLLTQRVGTATGTAAESFLSTKHRTLFDHMRRHNVTDYGDGIVKLRNGDLDLLVGDTPILDFYRGQEAGCTLRAIGPIMNEDTYAVGLNKGSPLKEPISSLIVKYNANGYLDFLTARWYHGLPCMRTTSEMYRPMRLSIRAVAGVFILLCLGMAFGLVILCLEHIFYKHALPDLRAKQKGTVWRSPNLMFFSQKLYRFINCVELVSPHHSAKELVNNLRTGKITSLFQKSIKRKEQDQRRRRKSKAQFFEMIQEIRRLRRTSKDNREAAQAAMTTAAAAAAAQRHHPNPAPKIRFRLLSQADTASTTVAESLKKRQKHSKSTKSQLHVADVDIVTRGTFEFNRRTNRPNLEDSTCVRLIERVNAATSRAGNRHRRRRRRYSCTGGDTVGSSDSDDLVGAGVGAESSTSTVGVCSRLSMSLGELDKMIDDEYKYNHNDDCQHQIRHSYDDLDGHRTDRCSEKSQIEKQHRRWRRTFRHSPPMTKFDFFDLPLRLNDDRLNKLSKEDIVLLWQNAERELRRRLRMALSEKHDLEKRLRQRYAKSTALDSHKPP